ncbi:MAG: tetratricopeptide repeat protein, partial [Anaerolineae bacterium]|nr:tetratricopeptide repeat protein [Anaerolineae bacterium]
IPDALLAKWNPATIALVAIDQFPLIKILSEGYETPLSEDLLKNSSVVYQRLTSPLSKPKNIVDAAYVSLWLREKRRSSGSWQGILPFVTVNDPQTLDTDLMSRWQTVLNILVSLVPDSDALQEMILDKSQGQQVYQILNETVFSSPSSVQEYIKQLYELIQKLDLSNQVNWLMGLNARGHADIVIAIAQMLLDLVNYEGSSEDPKRKLDASQIEDQFSIASLMQFAGRNNEAVDVLENLGSTLKNWTQSLVVKMVDADRSTLTAIRQKNIDLAEFDLPHRQRLALLLHGVTEQDEVLSKLDTNLLDPLVQLEIAQNALDGGNQEMARALAEQAITKLNEISNEELLALNHQSISRRSSNDAVKVLMNVELMSEAYQFATRLLDIRPNDPELIELAAMICQRTNDVHGVLDHASVGLILQPDSSKWHRRIAIAHETQEDWTRAYDSWKNVLKLEGMPSNSDIESFARCAYACGDYQGCISKCVKLLEESPDNGYAYQWIGTSAYQLGKYQEAIKSLIRSTALSPGEALGWLFLSESYIKLGDKRKALDVLRSAVLEVPASSELNYKLARLYLDFGLETDALPLLKSAAKLAPKDRSITTDLVQVLINLGFLKDARSVVENARMIWSQDAGLAEAHVYVLTALGDTQEALDPLRLLIAADDPKAEWLLQYAEVILGPECILLSHGFDATTIEEAASALAKVIAARPDNRKANILLAEVVASKGNYAEAYERYKKIIDTGSDEKSLPDLARRIRVGFGVVALKLGQFDFAVALLQEAANKRPNDIAILKLLAEALFAGDSKNEGMDIAKRVVNLEPINLEILEWFANAAIMAGYYTEALTALKTGVQYDALSGSRWLQMARIQTQVGDHEGASDTLSEFMKLAVVETDEYMEAGEIGLRLGDHELADMCYTRALETQDDPAVDLIFRASIVKIMNGDPENALGLIQMAVEKEPGNLPTLIIEADLLSYLDRTQAAMAVLEHAVEIVKDADDSEQDSIETQSYSIDLVPLAWLESLQSIDMVHARLSRLYLSVGKYDLAIKHAKQAIEHKKDNLDHLFFAIGLAFSCLNDALVEELITQYHQAISITDQTKYASSRIGVIALEALRTFEKGENIGALKLVNELVELSPDGELTKLLEIRSITTTGAREDALASLNDVYQLYDVQTNGIDTKNLFTQFETHNSVLDRNWFAIGAALDLYAWDVVNKILIDIQNSSTRNPRSDLYRAKALVVMAEDQVFFNELDCVSHTPDILAKSPEVASEINRILEPLGTVNEKETKRWTARIDCLLNTGEAQLNGLKEAALDAGDAAAIVAGYRRMKSFDVSEDVKRWMDDPNVLAQLAYSIQSTDGEQAIKLIQKAINNRPNDPILMRCLAMIYESNQNDQLSYAAIQNAIKWWDDEYKWLMTASDIARRLGDLPA